MTTAHRILRALLQKPHSTLDLAAVLKVKRHVVWCALRRLELQRIVASRKVGTGKRCLSTWRVVDVAKALEKLAVPTVVKKNRTNERPRDHEHQSAAEREHRMYARGSGITVSMRGY